MFIPNIRSPQIFQKSRNHLKILGAERPSAGELRTPPEVLWNQSTRSNVVTVTHTYALAHGYDEPISLVFLIKHTKSTRTYLPMKMEQSVPKRRHINFNRRGITHKTAYNKSKELWAFTAQLVITFRPKFDFINPFSAFTQCIYTFHTILN